MFEPLTEALAEVSCLDVMRQAQRCERVAVAQRWVAAGRLCLGRLADADDDRVSWCMDHWEAVAAEVGAQLGVSRGRASSDMHYGIELIERLPRLGAVFLDGDVDAQVVAAIIFRTGLIVDPEVLATVDAQLARLAPSWNGSSRKRLVSLIDWRIRMLDPAAVRVPREGVDEERRITVEPDGNGLAEVWGRVHAPDAAAFDERLTRLASTVCPNDPRTKEQRRADALGALAAGSAALACLCGGDDCQQDDQAVQSPVVIHLIADAAVLSGESEAPAILPNFGAIPAETVRDVAANAQVRTLRPGHTFGVESRYRPSTALAEFIRCRDMTCRFPGCDRPAEQADIDHTVPWPHGPTHPSNLKLLCRPHHLIKTFYTGPQGWTDRQHPDGTLTWTSPSGRTYTTAPGGALLFPQLAEPTGELVLPDIEESQPGRGLCMPTRRRTRAAERASRITWERGLNIRRGALDPPPF